MLFISALQQRERMSWILDNEINGIVHHMVLMVRNTLLVPYPHAAPPSRARSPSIFERDSPLSPVASTSRAWTPTLVQTSTTSGHNHSDTAPSPMHIDTVELDDTDDESTDYEEGERVRGIIANARAAAVEEAVVPVAVASVAAESIEVAPVAAAPIAVEPVATSPIAEMPECSICLLNPFGRDATAIMKCGHIFCNECLENSIKYRPLSSETGHRTKKKCPKCRVYIANSPVLRLFT